MLRLDLTSKPRWLDLGHGVRLRVAPLTTALMVAARSDPFVEALPDTVSDEERALVFAKALARRAVLAWEGIGDADGKAVARAYRWQRMLESGECASITELAAADKINRSYICRVLRLTLLAPEIVDAILDGLQPEEVTLPALMKPFSVEWGRQPFSMPMGRGARDR